jgi:hypothetical protein
MTNRDVFRIGTPCIKVKKSRYCHCSSGTNVASRTYVNELQASVLTIIVSYNTYVQPVHIALRWQSNGFPQHSWAQARTGESKHSYGPERVHMQEMQLSSSLRAISFSQEGHSGIQSGLLCRMPRHLSNTSRLAVSREPERETRVRKEDRTGFLTTSRRRSDWIVTPSPHSA